jgi:RNA polymerase sigma-70 factor (ECF subfamily)
MHDDTSAAALGGWAERLAAARGGSREALGDLLQQVRAYLLAIANKELSDELQAKGGPSDLVQDSLLEAQRDFAQFAGSSPDDLQAWLRRILLNNLVNFNRQFRGTDKRQVGREVSRECPHCCAAEPLANLTTPSAAAVRREQEQLLQRALDELPEHYRQIIVWRNREARSFAQIAEMLGKSADAARMLWGRALEALQQQLEGHREP